VVLRVLVMPMSGPELGSGAGKRLLLGSTRGGRKHSPSILGIKGESIALFPLETKAAWFAGSQPMFPGSQPMFPW